MCDIFLALPSVTADGSVIFGKNSDREPNEAQALEHHPAQVFSKPTQVQCTYMTIPQVRETYATLLCRPYGTPSSGASAPRFAFHLSSLI